VTQTNESPEYPGRFSLVTDINADWRKRLIKTTIKSVGVAAFAGSLIALSACSSNGKQNTDEAGSAAEVRQAKISAAPVSLSDQIALSTQDLAQRQGKDVSSITLVVARQVIWRSGALGCSGPGMSYTQEQVPGVLIVLQAGDENFGYHARSDGVPFYCPRERVEVPASIEAEDLA